MYKHFLQQSAWKKFEESEGKTTFTVKGDDFEALAILEETSLGNYLYVPYGPSLRIPKEQSITSRETRTFERDNDWSAKCLAHALDALQTLARDHSCFFVRIEPTLELAPDVLKSLGLKKSKDINPAHTWLLDLTQPREEILTHMAQGTRTRFNQFTKRGFVTKTSKNPEDIRFLIKLQHKLAKEKNINTFSDSYLRNELSQPFASLYYVPYKDPDTLTEKVISASLFFDDERNKTRYYMQSATDSDYKKLPATVGLLCASIFDAKEKGLKYFDFWGIAPNGAPSSHPWAGFTLFKKSFGGFPRAYSGTWDFPLSPAKYRLYRLLRRINIALRHLG